MNSSLPETWPPLTDVHISFEEVGVSRQTEQIARDVEAAKRPLLRGYLAPCDDGKTATIEPGQDGTDGGGRSTSPGGASAPPTGLWPILLTTGLFVRRRL